MRPPALHRRARPRAVLLTLLWTLSALAPQAWASAVHASDPPTGFDHLLNRADDLYARRHDGQRAGQGAPEPIARAITAYEQLLDSSSSTSLSRNLRVRWKLLEALYFQGDHVQREREAKRLTFERGREVFEAGLDLLAERVGGRGRLDAMSPEETARALADVPEAAPLYFWGTVSWGLWGEAFGKVAAVRQGVAGKLKHYIDTVLALDPAYGDAGGHRLKGRFHAEAPRIPFFTSWVDRELALRELRTAWREGRAEPLNGLYLAEAILDHESDRRDQAILLLRELAGRQPRAARLTEDLSVVIRARAELEALASRR